MSMLATRYRATLSRMVALHGSGPEARQRIAQVARDGLAELIRSGAASQAHRRFVDGREGAAEETVGIPGSIAYVFSSLAKATAFALGYVVERSPVESGAYKAGWFVSVDRQPWTQALELIPPGSEVMITNRLPYHRKIHVGGQRTSMPPYIVEDARQQLARRFSGLSTGVIFVTLPGGYVLKGLSWDSGLSWSSRRTHRKPWVGWSRRGPRRIHLRKDAASGQRMTYPALIIRDR